MTATLSETTPKLTTDQIVQFHRDGFLTLDRLAPRDEVQRIRELLDGLFDRFDELPKELAFDLGDLKHHAGERRTPQINNATQFEPRLLETQYFRNAQAIARQLLGPQAALSFDHAIYKPPHNGKEVPWHQDLAYGARDGRDRICYGCNIWMPLQDATIESGCMQFIPHSHLGNLRPHHPIGHDPKVHTLETDGVDGSKAAVCPVPAGGCTIHHAKTLHYTAPNATDHPRRALILFFGYPSMPDSI